jgi:hypothetical protein
MRLTFLLLPAAFLASSILASPTPDSAHYIDPASLTKDELLAVFEKIAPLAVANTVLSGRAADSMNLVKRDCERDCIREWCDVS